MIASSPHRARVLPQFDAAFGPGSDRGRAGASSLQLAQSPRLVAQRQAIRNAFGAAAQLKSADDDATQARSMPAPLKAGIEALSGLDLSDVRVHTNSARPAALNALAYAQGSDIHLAPGQERQLPHEAWHVVQQRQGRVPATAQMAGVGVNDDPALEREADRMGSQARSAMLAQTASPERTPAPTTGGRSARAQPLQLKPVLQRAPVEVSKARVDGPYSWTSKYQIDIRAKEAVLTIRIQVTPDAGVLAEDTDLIKTQTRTEFQRYWDRRFNLTDAAGKALPLRTQLEYTSTNPHATVKLHANKGPDDLSNWYVGSPSLTRAHELGHQLGMLDEYVDAKAPNRATAASPGVRSDNSLMGNYYTEGLDKAHVQQRHGDTLATDIGAATGTAYTAVASGIYIVRDGDTLEKIALRLLGDRAKWRDLYSKNQTVIGNDPNKIRPGMTLKL